MVVHDQAELDTGKTLAVVGLRIHQGETVELRG
jgi:hypothetical protein